MGWERFIQELTKKEKKYIDEISIICHETAEILHKAGVITKERMREYDENWNL